MAALFPTSAARVSDTRGGLVLPAVQRQQRAVVALQSRFHGGRHPVIGVARGAHSATGAAAVAFDVTTDNMPASMLSHVGLLGLSNPNVDLTGLGLTGCFQLASGDVLDFVVLPSGTTSHTWTALTIPAGPVFFNGFEFHVQSAIFGTNLNSFVGLGALTSNGLKCTIGDV